MSGPRDIDCPHCHATPEDRDMRVIVSSADRGVAEISHTKDCVDYEPVRPDEEPTG